MERDFDRALEFSRQAVAATPGDSYVVIYHGVLLSFDGQPEAGLEFARHALRLDPFNVRAPYLNILGTLYYHVGRYDEALEVLMRNVERGGPNSTWSVLRQAAVYYRLGRVDDALNEVAVIEDFDSAAEGLIAWTRRHLPASERSGAHGRTAACIGGNAAAGTLRHQHRLTILATEEARYESPDC